MCLSSLPKPVGKQRAKIHSSAALRILFGSKMSDLHKELKSRLSDDFHWPVPFRSVDSMCKRNKGKDPKPLTHLWRHPFSKPMAVCGVACYSVCSQPQQNSDPHLILMEKLKRVNHSTLIFMAYLPKECLEQKRECRKCWDWYVWEGKDCRFCIWHLSKPRRTLPNLLRRKENGVSLSGSFN